MSLAVITRPLLSHTVVSFRSDHHAKESLPKARYMLQSLPQAHSLSCKPIIQLVTGAFAAITCNVTVIVLSYLRAY